MPLNPSFQSPWLVGAFLLLVYISQFNFKNLGYGVAHERDVVAHDGDVVAHEGYVVAHQGDVVDQKGGMRGMWQLMRGVW